MLGQETNERRHPDTVVVARPEERLKPHWITGTQQLLLRTVPHHQREDAFQVMKAVHSEPAVETQHEFGMILGLITRQEKIEELIDVIELAGKNGGAWTVRMKRHDVIRREVANLRA